VEHLSIRNDSIKEEWEKYV